MSGCLPKKAFVNKISTPPPATPVAATSTATVGATVTSSTSTASEGGSNVDAATGVAAATAAAAGGANIVQGKALRGSGGGGGAANDALNGSDSEPSGGVSREGLTALYKFATGNSYHAISLRETLIEVGVKWCRVVCRGEV